MPPGCDIRLSGEAVRLRLIQPSDVLRVVCQPGDGFLAAHCIRVDPLARTTG